MSVAPFHAAPAPARPPSRRLLLVSHAFPPGNQPGALRWEKMSHTAVERGWAVDVVTLDPAALAVRDDTRLAGLPAGTRVFGVHEPAPFWHERLVRSAARAAGRARAAVRRRAPDGPTGIGQVPAQAAPAGAVDDVRAVRYPLRRRLVGGLLVWQDVQRERAWAAAAAATAARVAAERAPDLLVSSGPPHFPHEATGRLARALGVPHVMDMRDPWTLDVWITPDRDSAYARRERAAAEREAVTGALLVVCNTAPAAQALRALYPQHARKIVVVMNGSDDDPPPLAPPDPRFLLAYTGAIYGDRSPRTLFEALARVVRDEALTPDDLAMEFMGACTPTQDATVRMAAEYGVGAFVRQHPPQPRAAAARFLATASLLVSLPQSAEMSLPSKVFEYASYPAWMLALAGPRSATAQALAGSGADVVDPADVDGIVAAIRRRYHAWRAGVRPTPINADGRFSRRGQATRLFDLVDAALAARRGQPAASAPAEVPAGALVG